MRMLGRYAAAWGQLRAASPWTAVRPWGARRWVHSDDEASEPAVKKYPFDPLRILFCGSDEFSMVALEALHRESLADPSFIKRINVVTRPPKRVGAGLKRVREDKARFVDLTTAVPVASLARKLNLKLHQIDSMVAWEPLDELKKARRRRGDPVQDEDEAAHMINLVIAVSFGLLIPGRLLDKIQYGGLNVHPSQLPDLRGAAPIIHSLLENDRHIGVTLQTLHPTKMDHGHILDQTPFPGLEIPSPETITAPELTAYLAPVGAEMLIQGLKRGLFLSQAKSSWHDATESSEDPDPSTNAGVSTIPSVGASPDRSTDVAASPSAETSETEAAAPSGDASPSMDAKNTNAIGAATPSTESPSTESPSTESPSTESPSTESPSTESPSTESLSEQSPSTESLGAETPSADASSANTLSATTPSTDTTTPHTPNADSPKTSTNSTNTPFAETPTADIPTADTPTPDIPTADSTRYIAWAPTSPSIDAIPPDDTARSKLRPAPKIKKHTLRINWQTWPADKILRYQRILGSLWNMKLSHNKRPLRTIWSSGLEVAVGYRLRTGPGVISIDDSDHCAYIRTIDGLSMRARRITIEGFPEEDARKHAKRLALKAPTSVTKEDILI